ncbi:MAG: hypothetical protein WC627_11715 [Legionella sp.]|jgi:hypothetical protein
MNFDADKDNNTQKTLECTDKIQKVYIKPSITLLDVLNIETGEVNVPESLNGLLS